MFSRTMKNNIEIELMTPDEVADILKISKAQVMAYINSKILKSKKLSPRIIRISQQALWEFLTNAER